MAKWAGGWFVALGVSCGYRGKQSGSRHPRPQVVLSSIRGVSPLLPQDRLSRLCLTTSTRVLSIQNCCSRTGWLHEPQVMVGAGPGELLQWSSMRSQSAACSEKDSALGIVAEAQVLVHGRRGHRESQTSSVDGIFRQFSTLEISRFGIDGVRWPSPQVHNLNSGTSKTKSRREEGTTLTRSGHVTTTDADYQVPYLLAPVSRPQDFVLQSDI